MIQGPIRLVQHAQLNLRPLGSSPSGGLNSLAVVISATIAMGRDDTRNKIRQLFLLEEGRLLAACSSWQIRNRIECDVCKIRIFPGSFNFPSPFYENWN